MEIIMYSLGANPEECNQAKTALLKPVSSSESGLDQSTLRADEGKKKHCYTGAAGGTEMHLSRHDLKFSIGFRIILVRP
jgi:hypothetical protein